MRIYAAGARSSSFFSEERKNQRKVIYVFLPICYLNSNVLGLAIGLSIESILKSEPRGCITKAEGTYSLRLFVTRFCFFHHRDAGNRAASARTWSYVRLRFAARSRDFQTGAANGVNLLELHIDLLMLVKVAVDVFVGHLLAQAAWTLNANRLGAGEY